MKKIAVTGAGGDIGQVLLEHLKGLDYDVVAIDLNVKHLKDRRNRFACDLTNLGNLCSVLKDCDAIVHLAAHPGGNGASQSYIFENNMMSSYNVFEAAAILGINTIVAASSTNAAGNDCNVDTHYKYLPLDEAHSSHPDEAYGLAKLLTEKVADGYVLRYPDMKVISLRLPYIYFDDHSKCLSQNPKKEPSLYTWLHVQEVVMVIGLALKAGLPGHEVFYVQADETTSARDTMDLMKDFFPGLNIREAIPGRKSPISNEKAKRLLKWVPDPKYQEELNAKKPSE
ncbi:MAG: NAD(P)-dependent oxidoreductase [Lentisphaeria bacterium]|nr:NAD(P)-dependent oxidoreductase [Lentisphaeria bacterium]